MENDTIQTYIQDDKINLEKIIEKYSNYINSIIQNMTVNLLKNEDIEELISDVLFAVWKNKDKINKEMPLKPYIAGITKNLTKNRLRDLKIKTEEIDENISTDQTIEYIVQKKEEFLIIEEELKKYGEDANIFIMFYYKGMKAKEIAQKLYLTEANVNVKIHRIKKKIKKALKERGYNYGK